MNQPSQFIRWYVIDQNLSVYNCNAGRNHYPDKELIAYEWQFIKITALF